MPVGPLCFAYRFGCSIRHAALTTALLLMAPVAACAVSDGVEPSQALRPALADPAQPAIKDAGPPTLRGAKKTVRYIWRINHGDTISDALRAWARQSRQWQVAWEAPELVAQATVDLDGSFEDAVVRVIEALNRNDANLLARFYIDKGSSVLRVMEKK